MRCFLFILIGLVVITPMLCAEPWEFSLEAGLGVNQSAFSDSWQGGSAGGFTWVATTNFLAQKQLAEKLHSKTTLKLAFGQSHVQEQETKHWLRPTKSSDLVDLESVLRLTLGWFADPFVAARFESQFLDRSDSLKDRLFNPMKVTESFGLAKTLLKAEKQESNVRLGLAIHQAINRDVLDPVSLARSNVTSTDGGVQLDLDLKTPVGSDRVTYTSKLTLFQALIYSKSKELEGLPNANYWKQPDLNWDNALTGNITDFLAVNLGIQFIYDRELDARGQIKEALTLGVTYVLK